MINIFECILYDTSYNGEEIRRAYDTVGWKDDKEIYFSDSEEIKSDFSNSFSNDFRKEKL